MHQVAYKADRSAGAVEPGKNPNSIGKRVPNKHSCIQHVVLQRCRDKRVQIREYILCGKCEAGYKWGVKDVNDLNLIVPNIEMNENNTHSHQQSSLPISVKINHPKLINFPINMPSYYQVVDLLHFVKESTMFKMFSNYHLAYNGNLVGLKTILGDLAGENSQVELDVAFQHYNYATAMYHYETVSKLLKEPHKFAILLRADQKCIEFDKVEPEAMGKELLPPSFKVSKSNI